VLVPVAPSNRFYRLTAVTNLNVTSDSYLVVDLSGGPSASSYPVSYLSTVPDGGWTDEYKTTNMVFRRIPAGTFTMGSPTNELGRESAWGDETQHQVTLMQPFYVGVFEVTQRQWERVMGTWPGYFNNVSYRDARPVERVSYNMIRGGNAGTNWPANANVDADSFMGRLRARTGKTFDLPTESQWEYAGRAGTTTALNSGKNLTNVETCPNMFEVGRYWYSGGSGYSQNGDTSGGTAKAGTYLPNAWGLYDIHGNVWEWCLDWYPGYEGSYRVFRGGSWNYGASYCRVAHRGATSAGDAYDIMGFRAAMPSGQ
jgi:formylglycine-generating enzyme required for sulfatase activity